MVAAFQQNFHIQGIIVRAGVSGALFQPVPVGLRQQEPGGFRAAQFQSQLEKAAVVMGQPGEFPTGFAQCLFAQLRLDAAQAVLPPHGTAGCFQGQVGGAVFLLEEAAQPVTQFSGQAAVVGAFFGIHCHIPQLAAAVGAGGGDAVKGMVKGRRSSQHGNVLLKNGLPQNAAARVW